jgi:ArsR family metal-binding transcriptional regulator
MTTHLKFYRALLYSLCQSRTSFNVNAKLHTSFGDVIKYANSTFPSSIKGLVPDIYMDPMFGTYSEVSEMLWEGQQDLLIAIHNSKASFTITKDQALLELTRLLPNNINEFHKLGEILSSSLD